MPAPVPIQIRYGSPAQLGGLAAAAGTASYNLGERRYADQIAQQQYRDQYNEYLTRLSADTSFLNAEAQRRAQDVWQQNELDFRYNALRQQPPSATMLQDAAGYGGVQTFRRQPDPARQAAQAAGTVTSTAGRAASPLQLVPATGPISEAETEPSIRLIDERTGTEYQRYRKGTPVTIAGGADAEDRRIAQQVALGMEAEIPAMVPLNVRQQMDTVKSLQGVIPTDQWNAMWTAAQSGQLDMNQLLTQARQLIPGSGGDRMTAWQRDLEGFQSEANELSIVKTFSPEQQLAYARRKLNLPPQTAFGEGYTDEEALGRLNAYISEMESFARPITNSNGQTPTGGNWVRVNSPQEAAALPPGTRYITPDGRTMVR